MSNEKTKQKLNFLSVVLIFIGVVCIGVSAWGVYGILSEYKNAVDKYDKLEEEFVDVYVPPVDTENEGETSTEKEEPEIPWYQLVSVDLKGLQKKYPEVVGWLYFENEKISYPIMQAADNEKYLDMTYDGKKSTSGSIFMDRKNMSDFSDVHTIIYGHNMKNLGMFGKLKYYKTIEGYYEDHQYFQVFCGNQVLRYRIFAYEEVGVDSFVYQEEFTSGRVLANKLVANSMINEGIYFKDTDKIITLSTCTADDDHRFIVCAVLVDSHTIK